jgi:zinc/manganese transport system substrate-binding protein
MNTTIRGGLALLLLALAFPSQAAVRVLATTADWGALTRELGGERVDVYTATSALQDVHRVEAKPSLVARARTAELLVANGAELEVGWLPILLQESGNRMIQRNAPGYFEATSAVTLVEKPEKFDRAMGDIHPLGNPHIHLDPRNVASVAKALTAKLTAIDPAGADYYARRWRAGRPRPRRSRTSRS